MQKQQTVNPEKYMQYFGEVCFKNRLMEEDIIQVVKELEKVSKEMADLKKKDEE